MIRSKIFPFAKGIQYQLKYGKYIIPELNRTKLNLVLKNHEVIIYSDGGLLENYISLAYAEAFSEYTNNILWAGNKEFEECVKCNSLCTYTNLKINTNNYPVPLFFDAHSKYAIFNVLNNYINVKTYLGKYSYDDDRSIVKQAFRNSLLEWDPAYKPKFRQNESEDISKWMSANKLSTSDSFILIFPDHTKWSKASIDCLGWSTQDVKSFCSMLSRTKYKILVATDRPGIYYGTNCVFVPMKMHVILWLLKEAIVTLAQDPEYLILTMMLSDGLGYSKKAGSMWSFRKNSKYLKCPNNIETFNSFTPLDIYERII